MNSDRIRTSIVDAYASRFETRQRRDGLEILTPHLLHDGTPLRLRVSEAGDGYLITDDGQLLEYLEMSGVDIDNKRIWSSWEMLRGRVNNSGDAYLMPTEVEPWELAAHSSPTNLGNLFAAVAAVAMQVDGLHHLANAKSARRRRPFRQEALAQLQETLHTSINIIPDYRIPSRGVEGQTVWAALTTPDESKTLYLEAVGPSDTTGDVNRAMATYAISSTHRDERAVLKSTEVDEKMDDIKRMGQMADVVDISAARSLQDRIESPYLDQAQA